MKTYKSVTDFDRTLELDITETSGSFSGVMQSWRGFRSKDEATRFGDWWKERIGWGYCPQAFIREDENGSWYCNTTRWNSCD